MHAPISRFLFQCATVSAVLLPFKLQDAYPQQFPFWSQGGMLSQKPTSATANEPTRAFELGEHPISVIEQTSDICDAGSRQFTGSIDINSDKSMFFWYFESRGNPNTDPVILWMSGGPGATGELGLFKGSGPCRVNDDGNSTSSSKYTWTNHASVIYIDQPIGIGFSKISDPAKAATNLHAGARDLYQFLSIFASRAFPHLAERTWHIAGESMGGHYSTGYVHYMLRQEEERKALGLAPLLPFRIDSIIAVDAYIDNTREAAGYYEFFCQPTARDGLPRMNETACTAMAAAVPECERLGEECRVSYDPDACFYASVHCELTVGAYYLPDVKPGGWNPYDAREKCIEPPLCSDLDGGPLLEFLNQPWLQERLGFSNFSFQLIDFELNTRWSLDRDLFLPTTRQLTWLLDKTDLRILFLNGNEDIIINTPGQLRMLDAQPWHLQAPYRLQPLQYWHYHDAKIDLTGKGDGKTLGGQYKSYGRLSFFTVDEAGHTSPYDNPEAVESIINHWIQ